MVYLVVAVNVQLCPPDGDKGACRQLELDLRVAEQIAETHDRVLSILDQVWESTITDVLPISSYPFHTVIA